MPSLPLNTNWIPHLKLGLVVGLWLAVFLVVVGPFDSADLSLKIRAILLPPYGLLFMMAYLLAVGVQNRIHKRLGSWNWWWEALIIGISYLIGVGFCYAYYKTDLVRGTYPFSAFLSAIYLPTTLILSLLLLAGRWFISREAEVVVVREKEASLTLSGAGHKDLLQLQPRQLVYAISAQNYVEVHYLVDGKLKKHLLRTTLKNLEGQTNHLLRVHRSHLINPQHFRRWVGSGELEVAGALLPVSKQYREHLLLHLKTEEHS